MIQKILRKAPAFFVCTALSLLLALPALVSAETFNYGLDTNFNQIDLGTSQDFYGVIAEIVNVLLSFLGVLAVLIILYGGFLWMTAAGNDDQVRKGRTTITQGIIGLFIIFSAWGIATFVLEKLRDATNI